MDIFNSFRWLVLWFKLTALIACFVRGIVLLSVFNSFSFEIVSTADSHLVKFDWLLCFFLNCFINLLFIRAWISFCFSTGIQLFNNFVIILYFIFSLNVKSLGFNIITFGSSLLPLLFKCFSNFAIFRLIILGSSDGWNIPFVSLWYSVYSLTKGESLLIPNL